MEIIRTAGIGGLLRICGGDPDLYKNLKEAYQWYVLEYGLSCIFTKGNNDSNR